MAQKQIMIVKYDDPDRVTSGFSNFVYTLSHGQHNLIKYFFLIRLLLIRIEAEQAN